MYDTYIKHAQELYERAMAAEGKTRRRFLREALNILASVPEGAEGRDTLAARLEDALQNS